MSRNQKDIARARRMQDEYALAEKRYERSRARGDRNSAFRKKDEALGRKVLARGSSAVRAVVGCPKPATFQKELRRRNELRTARKRSSRKPRAASRGSRKS